MMPLQRPNNFRGIAILVYDPEEILLPNNFTYDITIISLRMTQYCQNVFGKNTVLKLWPQILVIN